MFDATASRSRDLLVARVLEPRSRLVTERPLASKKYKFNLALGVPGSKGFNLFLTLRKGRRLSFLL